MIQANFGPLLDKSPADLTRADFRAVLDAGVTRGAPISGKRAARYLKRVLSWAVQREDLPLNPADGLDLNELTRPERERQRILSDDEIRAVWRASLDMSSPFGDLTRLYLLSGLRRDEAASARWSDLDGDTLVIGSTKSNRPHRLPLSNAAMQIIRAQPRRGESIFTLSVGTPVASASTNWHRARVRMQELSGTTNWTWHDLRRTARTLLARIGTDDLVAELILNHAVPGKLRRTYNLHKYEDEMREALERLAAFLKEIVVGKTNIIRLGQAAGHSPPGWHPGNQRFWGWLDLPGVARNRADTTAPGARPNLHMCLTMPESAPSMPGIPQGALGRSALGLSCRPRDQHDDIALPCLKPAPRAIRTPAAHQPPGSQRQDYETLP